jgi:hypothetical protein
VDDASSLSALPPRERGIHRPSLVRARVVDIIILLLAGSTDEPPACELGSRAISSPLRPLRASARHAHVQPCCSADIPTPASYSNRIVPTFPTCQLSCFHSNKCIVGTSQKKKQPHLLYTAGKKESIRRINQKPGHRFIRLCCLNRRVFAP